MKYIEMESITKQTIISKIAHGALQITGRTRFGCWNGWTDEAHLRDIPSMAAKSPDEYIL